MLVVSKAQPLLMEMKEGIQELKNIITSSLNVSDSVIEEGERGRGIKEIWTCQ